MDPQARHLTWDIVRALKGRGVTVILTTHLLDEAERLADRVAIVDAGQLIALGTPAELTGVQSADEIRLVIAESIDLDRLRSLRWATSARRERSGTIVLSADRPLDLLAELADWLRANEIAPRTIQIGHESLEDVFLRLTGKELRE